MFDLFDTETYTDLDQLLIKYINGNLEQVAFMRIRELAEAVHVSPATVMRFSQKAGFASFPEMKVAIKNYVEQQKSILKNEERRRGILPLDVFSNDLEEQIDLITAKLIEAPLIYYLGMGSSGVMAEYAAKQFTTIGLRSFHATSLYLPYLKESQKHSPKDVTLLFSVSGETFEILHIANLLKEAEAFSVSITNHIENHLAGLTSINLSYDTSYDRLQYNVDISSQLPVVFIIETLVKKLYLLMHSGKKEELNQK